MANFWRKESPVLGRDNQVIKGGMFDHQRQWWELQSFIKALVAGYGSGKSFIGSKRAISMALVNAPAPFLAVSPSYKIAKRTIIPTILGLLDGKKSLDGTLRYKYKRVDNEIQISHRGRNAKIWIGSGDDPDSLKGPNVSGAWIDEPFIQKRSVFEQTLARVRDPRSRYLELLLTGTPEELNWGYDICEGEEADNFDMGIVHAHTSENIALGEEYHQRLEKGFDEKAARAYLGGQFVNLSKGQVYYGFSRERNVVKLDDPGIDLEVGMDFNVNPMAAVVFWRKGNHVHIVKEIELENADTQYMCSVLSEIHFPRDHALAGKPRVSNVYPDASGKARHTNAPGGASDFTYIEEAGFYIRVDSVNPKIRDRENAVNAKLNPKSGAPTLTIDPSCKRLINYLLQYTHEKKNKIDYKAMSHLLDAVGYPIAFLFPVNRGGYTTTKLSGH